MGHNSSSERPSRQYGEMQTWLAETASRLMSEGGSWPSISALAKEVGIKRTTAHYYFANQMALMGGIEAWVGSRLIEDLIAESSSSKPFARWAEFALDHPAAVKLLVDDLITSSDIRQQLPEWDELIGVMTLAIQQAHPEAVFDAEVQLAVMVAGALQAPVLLLNCVGASKGRQEVIERLGNLRLNIF